MPKQPYTKPALTIAQQLAQLRKRGMVINDTALASHYLSQINYYRLTAYWLPFEVDHTTHTLTLWRIDMTVMKSTWCHLCTI